MSNVFFPIMHLDSVASSHSISVDVNNPDEINEIFDGITYGKVNFCYFVFASIYHTTNSLRFFKKGGSVIRMMNYFLSDNVFMNGLSV